MALRWTAFVGLTLLTGLAGCSSSRTEQFNVAVHNSTSGPLTLSLAKDGPPYEVAWASPEDLAIETPRRREDWKKAPGGMGVLPPGKTATVRNLKGQFDAQTHGFLRAYAGDLNISEMLSKSRGSPDRVDVELKPGANDITIVTEGTHIAAK